MPAVYIVGVIRKVPASLYSLLVKWVYAACTFLMCICKSNAECWSLGTEQHCFRPFVGMPSARTNATSEPRTLDNYNGAP